MRQRPRPNPTVLPLHIIQRGNNRSACCFAVGIPLTCCHGAMLPMVHRQSSPDLPQDVGLHGGYSLSMRAALPLRIGWTRLGVINYRRNPRAGAKRLLQFCGQPIAEFRPAVAVSSAYFALRW